MSDDLLELADYRRRVSELYAQVRELGGREAWEHWRAARDQLAGEHPQGVIAEENRAEFAGFPYFDYDPTYCVLGRLEAEKPDRVDAPRSGGGGMAFVRAGTLHFALDDVDLALELLWLDAYGGGLFLPFRDATSGQETYGGGRYLLDGAKSADLGWDGEHLLLDFNFAYHPSCAHEPRWSCPLAPPGNSLDVAVRAGERF